MNSVGPDNFEWIVENTAKMAIARAQAHKDGQMNLTWGTFIKEQFVKPAAQKAVASKSEEAPKAAKKPAAVKPTAKKK